MHKQTHFGQKCKTEGFSSSVWGGSLAWLCLRGAAEKRGPFCVYASRWGIAKQVREKKKKKLRLGNGMWKYNSVRPLLMKVCRGELDLEQRQRLKLSCATKGAGVSRGELNSPLTANTNRSYCLVGMRPDLPPFFFFFLRTTHSPSASVRI